MKLYHVMPEIIAFFLTSVLYIYHLCEKDLYRARQQNLLSTVMIVSLITTAVNIVSCAFIITEAAFSCHILFIIHGLCFLLSIIQASLLLRYVVNMVYAVSPRAYRARFFLAAIQVMIFANAAALIINIPTGIIYTVDPVTCEYIRGPMSFFTSVSVMIEIIMSQTVLLMERKYQTPEFSRLAEACPPIVAVLLLCQIIMRNMQLGGLIGFTVLLFMVFNLATNHLLEDEVTGFPNMICFENTLRDAFSRGKVFAVVRLRISSLEGLKRTFGEKETENIIRDVSLRLVSLRGLIHIFRTGEDEFMLIAPGMESRECARFADELVTVFEQQWYLGDSV
ncbi:MAG: diguanylate cyclase domain-containing protein, partial [Bullifex sp.]